MPHPRIQRWVKTGKFCLGKGTDDIFYCVLDDLSRASFHELLRIFAEIEYASSCKIQLDGSPKLLDPAIEKFSPKWGLGEVKVMGGNGERKLNLYYEQESFSLELSELIEICSKPNLGYDEVYLKLDGSRVFSIW